MRTVVLDRGHHGKISDERGAKFGHLIEEVLVRDYMAHAEDRLRELGYRVVIQMSHPERAYKGRWKRADAYDPVCYVQCHVNAGGGDYGLAVFDHRSQHGGFLAAHVVGKLGEYCPELRRSLARSGRDFPRAQNVISGVRAVAMVYEPGFIDNRTHGPLWTADGLRRVGLALADGIDAWVKSR